MKRNYYRFGMGYASSNWNWKSQGEKCKTAAFTCNLAFKTETLMRVYCVVPERQFSYEEQTS
jgi:hypothetical protein